MKVPFLFSGVILAFIILSQLSCSKDAETGFATLSINHAVSGETLEFENIRYNAAAGHIYSVVRLKYYISKISLHQTGGSTINIDKVHYVDGTSEDAKSLSLGQIPASGYDRISFIFGLDESTNVDGGLPNTQTNINMEWPIPGDQGYHYMKFEGKYDSLGTGVIKNFNLHTGATMGNQNFIEVSLPLSSFYVDGNSWKINLEMDLNEWMQNPNIYDFEEFGPMIMMNQNAQHILKVNGTTVFSILSVEKE